MDCRKLKDLFLGGEEAPLRAHAAGCAGCRRWLEREEKLLELCAGLREEAARATAGLRVEFHPPRAGRFLPWVAAAAAVVLVAALPFLLRHREAPASARIALSTVVITGKVADDAAPPAYIEVEGRRFPVRRVSQDAGVWRAELTLPAGKREIVLTARDAAGNVHRKRIVLHY